MSNSDVSASCPAIPGKGDHLQLAQQAKDGGRGAGIDDSPSTKANRRVRRPFHRARARSPSPVFTGEDEENAISFSRCSRIRVLRFVFTPSQFFVPPIIKGGGAPQGASYWNAVPKAARLRAYKGARSPLGAPPRCLGLGPRFLESPDANGRTLSGTSAASTWQSDHAPDGRCPKPPGTGLQAPPAGTALAPSTAVTGDVPDGRDSLKVTEIVTDVKSMSHY